MKVLSEKKIYLVDLDETLLDFRRAERENVLASLAMHGISADEGVAARFHEINDGLWKALERGETTREELKTERFRLLMREYDMEGDPRAVARAYFDRFPEICYPYAGAREFLAALHAHGSVYIATNGSAPIQHRHIAIAGFSPYLRGVFISEEVGADKPSAEYARRVRERIENFAPADTVWIGDSLTSDMVCAKRMGVDFILYAPAGIPTGYEGHAANSYSSLLRLLGIRQEK